MHDPRALHRGRARLRGRRRRGRALTTAGGRSGALEAIERIVNRGENVVERSLVALSGLYTSVELRPDGTIRAEGASEHDAAFLRRVETLISAHVSSAENA